VEFTGQLVHLTIRKKVGRMGSGKVRPFTFQEQLALIWYIIDANTHLTIELGYVWLALTSTAKKSDSFLGFIWREYGRADARWAVRDVNVISIEIMTVLMGILCLFQIYGTYYRKPWRHPMQILICVAELYGGWMTFAPGTMHRYLLRCAN
jgi:hypothetical protein